MATFNARHDCPGRCGRRIIHKMLACAPCWRLLPYDLQRAVADADFERRRHASSAMHAIAHRRAAAAVRRWYRIAHNTAKETTP